MLGGEPGCILGFTGMGGCFFCGRCGETRVESRPEGQVSRDQGCHGRFDRVCSRGSGRTVGTIRLPPGFRCCSFGL
ncbi:hypothetical protein C791_0933 [Amycolatopsis azurea DSM 43854]|uniref:Uncharacterized protein n=1 Tax=Amycolatopsis azurea DSM 43854 TaxID=1238180 RepID=M2Q4N4_9PSEU|nr:hypothetical protein C791_0933 [Amycolatopsis azurea DSM 43854]